MKCLVIQIPEIVDNNNLPLFNALGLKYNKLTDDVNSYVSKTLNDASVRILKNGEEYFNVSDTSADGGLIPNLIGSLVNGDKLTITNTEAVKTISFNKNFTIAADELLECVNLYALYGGINISINGGSSIDLLSNLVSLGYLGSYNINNEYVTYNIQEVNILASKMVSKGRVSGTLKIQIADSTWNVTFNPSLPNGYSVK